MGLVGCQPEIMIVRILAGELVDDYRFQPKFVVNAEERAILIFREQCVQLVSVTIATFRSVKKGQNPRLAAGIAGHHGSILEAMVEHRHVVP